MHETDTDIASSYAVAIEMMRKAATILNAQPFILQKHEFLLPVMHRELHKMF
jgi:hypothetical protein